MKKYILLISIIALVVFYKTYEYFVPNLRFPEIIKTKLHNSYNKAVINDLLKKKLNNYIYKILNTNNFEKYYVLDYNFVEFKIDYYNNIYWNIYVFISDKKKFTTNLFKVSFTITEKNLMKDINIQKVHNSESIVNLNDDFLYGVNTLKIINPKNQSRLNYFGPFDLIKNTKEVNRKNNSLIGYNKNNNWELIKNEKRKYLTKPKNIEKKVGWPYYIQKFKWNTDSVLDTNSKCLHKFKTYNSSTTDNVCEPYVTSFYLNDEKGYIPRIS